MATPLKICPICGSTNHHNATVCNTCGTTLSKAEPIAASAKQPAPSATHYDFRYGETDLFEPNLRRVGQVYGLVGFLIVAALLSAGLIFGLGPILMNSLSAANAGSTPLPQPTSPLLLVTNTPRPTLNLATVTPGPPTQEPTLTPSETLPPTETPTPTPCIQRVAPGDDLITLALRCGHRSMDVIDVILELNGLSDPSRIQVDQVIEIPWPTATIDPNAIPTSTPEANTGSSSGDTQFVASNATSESDLLPFDPFAPTATKTLQPGVMWHTVAFGENIVVIALRYGANVEILSQLNPEVTFAQCDFSIDSGGGSCTVNLFEGQLLRVPAPTATPTLPPTPSGSETPTPTVTPTFNAPSALSPTDRSFFTNDQIITLRWISTGTLSPGEVYHVDVKNVTTGDSYTMDTQELFVLVPSEWQGIENERYEYQWTVSVKNAGRPDELRYTTEPRTFIWQGRGS